MKKAILLLFIAFSAVSLQAQELEWQTDITKAVALSEKTKKPLLMFFTGSDWCGWCMRLQKEVLKTPEFAKWAQENVVLVELDFPRRTPQSEELKSQNAQLNQFFQVRGYPTVWFAHGAKGADGKISFDALGSTGYVAGGPAAWLDGANKILKNKKA
ncbi:thioredoxin fold domain-containing protein [Flavobacterium sp. Sd200]|uniref:thioredoxin family protein n=1 Tax=Flavobacterium sp. Sd200 TaxID=2692211 RepID=UPI00136F6487|nr:thioredoxin family protein [Flavobacterium sp. Sd200]MXN92226.1 thioredoxin fold domain-containing protein [Flavobacterium sp. Sd200]